MIAGSSKADCMADVPSMLPIACFGSNISFIVCCFLCRRTFHWSPRSVVTTRLGPCTRKSLSESPTAWAWRPARTITTTSSLQTKRTTPAWHIHKARGRRNAWTRNTQRYVKCLILLLHSMGMVIRSYVQLIIYGTFSWIPCCLCVFPLNVNNYVVARFSCFCFSAYFVSRVCVLHQLWSQDKCKTPIFLNCRGCLLQFIVHCTATGCGLAGSVLSVKYASRNYNFWGFSLLHMLLLLSHSLGWEMASHLYDCMNVGIAFIYM